MKQDEQKYTPFTHKHTYSEPDGTPVFLPTFRHRIEIVTHKSVAVGIWTGKNLIAPVLRGFIYVGAGVVLFTVGMVVAAIKETFVKNDGLLNDPFYGDAEVKDGIVYKDRVKTGQYVFNNCNINNINING